jgi:hypothetical protein
MTTNETVVDNDVLIKLACYRFLQEAITTFGGPGSVGILGAARFVVTSHIRRSSSIHDRAKALESFAAFLGEVDELEPTEDEVALATEIEEAATRALVELHFGESQLCAIVLSRTVLMLVTGDKRAIVAAEALKSDINRLAELKGKLVCLEQLILGLTGRVGHAVARDSICAEPNVDKALAICFGCRLSEQVTISSTLDGLRSYIRDLRSKAPTLLHPQDAVPASS